TAARSCGIQMIRAAGAADVDDDWLTAALIESAESAAAARRPGEPAREAAGRAEAIAGRPVALRPAIEAFAIQLDIPARDWFLAKVVEVGLADGPLTAAQRTVAEEIARYLGMTASRGEDVISLAEQAAQAG